MKSIASYAEGLKFASRNRRWLPLLTASLFYLLLTVILTWPLIIRPSDAVFGVGDAFHHLWILWHTKEAVLLQDGWFNTSYLFYPQGTSLSVHSLGPLLGFVALPFWSFGPETAYNAAVFVGFLATGIAMNILARELGFSWIVALFAGTLYIVAPLHLVALHGHLTKVFLGMLPLSLWAYHRALSRERSMMWPFWAGLIMLLTLLHSTEQYIFAGLAFAIYGIIRLLMAEPPDRRFLLVRLSATAGATFLLCGLPLFQIWEASNHMGIDVAVNVQSYRHHPDLVQLFVPSGIGWPLYGWLTDWIRPYAMSSLTTSIFLTWTAIALMAVAIVRRIRPAREWIYFSIVCIIFALGPTLRVMGRTEFTDYDIPIILPYAFLTSIPGLDHMRTPGRFMLIGSIGVAIVASYGLAWLVERLRSKTIAYLLVAVAIAMPIAETWMHPLSRDTMPPVSDFYNQIAEDPDSYGIFDLPIKPDGVHNFGSWHIYHSSLYQMLQMVHRKGIATGYISRHYATHPVFGQAITENFITESPNQTDVTVDDLPASRYANMMYELARNNFRYVIVHKTGWSGEPTPDWGMRASQTFVEEVFDERPPVYEDELITVYAVDPLPDVTSLEFGIAMLEPSKAQSRWDLNHRRIQSPTQFVLFSPKVALLRLDFELETLISSDRQTIYDSGTLQIHSGETLVYSSTVFPGEKIDIPLTVEPGSQRFTFTILEGESGQMDGSVEPIEARIEKMNLITPGITEPLMISEQGQYAALISSHEDDTLQVAMLQGWYGEEGSDGDISWYWAESPARIAVFSPAPIPMRLTATPIALHDPDSPSGKGERGVLRLHNGNEPATTLAIEAGKPFAFDFEATEGWNMITLDLVAGNFEPIDYEPASGDTRPLSFALSDLDVKRTD